MRNSDNLYFILSSSCALTKGHSRTLIQDFCRNYANFIPNEYYNLCMMLDRHLISDIVRNIEKQSLDSFYMFIDFMLSKEYAFLVDDLLLFPPKSHEVNDSSIMLNDAIIEIDEHNFKKDAVMEFLEEAKSLGCRNLQIRLFSFSGMEFLLTLANIVCNYNYTYIELHLDNSNSICYDECCQVIRDFAPISNIYIYNAKYPNAKDYYIRTKGCYELQMGSVVFIDTILDNKKCGAISKFCQVYDDEKFYRMSQKYNSCLFKKIALDRDGNVRNCLSLPETYDFSEGLGHIVASSEFKKYWNIKKDDIQTCKDCEFRYNCLDCRARTENGDLLGKPLTCTYNPYSLKI